MVVHVMTNNLNPNDSAMIILHAPLNFTFSNSLFKKCLQKFPDFTARMHQKWKLRSATATVSSVFVVPASVRSSRNERSAQTGQSAFSVLVPFRCRRIE